MIFTLHIHRPQISRGILLFCMPSRLYNFVYYIVSFINWTKHFYFYKSLLNRDKCNTLIGICRARNHGNEILYIMKLSDLVFQQQLTNPRSYRQIQSFQISENISSAIYWKKSSAFHHVQSMIIFLN